MLNIAVISLGCAKNLVDSENMLALIKKAGFKISAPEKAEIIIINTCGFITSAKEESINTILEAAQLKETGNCKSLIIAGCLVQKYYDELKKEIPEVDAFLGTGNFQDIVETILQLKQKNNETILKIDKNEQEYCELPRYYTSTKSYAYVRIAEGCDNNCTYCVIPELRGGYRSRKKENILKEIKNLVSNGTKEIILIAQDTVQYGRDLDGKNSLVDLLKEIVLIDDLKWVRLLYCYPNLFSDELIQIIKEEEKICKYIDLPLQHADDTILKKMGRKINQKEIKDLLKRIKNNIPEIKIRSTFIVGFPGESNIHFQNLMNFLQEIKLDRVGAFTYSQEEGTPAAKMPQQITEKIKQKRLKELMDLQYSIIQEKHKQLLNKKIIVKVDGLINKEENVYCCRSEGEAPEIDPLILIESTKSYEPGKMLLVKITHLHDYDLIGEIDRELT